MARTPITNAEEAVAEAVAGRRVKLRLGRQTVAVVSLADLRRLEDLEDAAEARAALAEFKASGEEAIPAADLRRQLGLAG
ncbi:MAG: hypothetical protein AMXMBFR83_25180 [Phycisphaerae bacterium]